mmetsp:Transcript_22829/g.49698  ORF Transcript_22829/g.49698 Transcript_22829/m.49698 type:complete len:81 (-) Transcript_22829:563-805(-)
MEGLWEPPSLDGNGAHHNDKDRTEPPQTTRRYRDSRGRDETTTTTGTSGTTPKTAIKNVLFGVSVLLRCKTAATAQWRLQ